MRCPQCGAEALDQFFEMDISLYCRACDWEEGGPTDFGFVAMEARPFCPEPPADQRGPIARFKDWMGL